MGSRYSFHLRVRTWCAIGVFALVGVVGYSAYLFYWTYSVLVANCYAQEWAGSLVIEHLQQNAGAWPTGWKDLEEPYASVTAELGSTRPLAEIEQRAQIRFDVDPAKLRAMSFEEMRSLEVVKLRSGESHNWAGFEPNRMIWNYLNGREPVESDREKEARAASLLDE